MKNVKIKPNQCIFDIALEQYGNVAAVAEIAALNPGLKNEPRALDISNMNPESDGLTVHPRDDDFRLDAAIAGGSTILVDETSRLVLKPVLKNIEKAITTYQYKNFNHNEQDTE